MSESVPACAPLRGCILRSTRASLRKRLRLLEIRKLEGACPWRCCTKALHPGITPGTFWITTGEGPTLRMPVPDARTSFLTRTTRARQPRGPPSPSSSRSTAAGGRRASGGRARLPHRVPQGIEGGNATARTPRDRMAMVTAPREGYLRLQRCLSSCLTTRRSRGAGLRRNQMLERCSASHPLQRRVRPAGDTPADCSGPWYLPLHITSG